MNNKKAHELELLFDLINAFSIVRNSKDSALFLQDLLTRHEVKNLSKRLRIAKLLLAGMTHREVASTTNVSIATVTKVSLWLQEGGEGFTSVISKLPKKYDIPDNLRKKPIEFQAPQAIYALAKYTIAKKQDNKLLHFSEKLKNKSIEDKKIHEAYSDYYKNRKK